MHTFLFIIDLELVLEHLIPHNVRVCVKIVYGVLFFRSSAYLVICDGFPKLTSTKQIPLADELILHTKTKTIV